VLRLFVYTASAIVFSYLRWNDLRKDAPMTLLVIGQ
jgi:hypothetical protein